MPIYCQIPGDDFHYTSGEEITVNIYFSLNIYLYTERFRFIHIDNIFIPNGRKVFILVKPAKNIHASKSQ